MALGFVCWFSVFFAWQKRPFIEVHMPLYFFCTAKKYILPVCLVLIINFWWGLVKPIYTSIAHFWQCDPLQVLTPASCRSVLLISSCNVPLFLLVFYVSLTLTFSYFSFMPVTYQVMQIIERFHSLTEHFCSIHWWKKHIHIICFFVLFIVNAAVNILRF